MRDSIPFRPDAQAVLSRLLAFVGQNPVSATPPRSNRPFPALFECLLDFAQTQFAAGLLQAGVQCAPAVQQAVLDFLEQRLRAAAIRVILLDLNSARLLARLEGEDTQARFHYFSATAYRAPGAISTLLGRYPELADLLAGIISDGLNAALDLLLHYEQDREALAVCFNQGQDPGPVLALECGLSDPHCGAHTVAALSFACGLKLIYKPRSLAADQRFQELLQTLNQAGLPHPHRCLRLLECGTHGWSEFVQFQACSTEQELARFYWRQGSLLCLLYLLNAQDFHFQNLIAASEFPVLIDLEGLFQPRLQAADKVQDSVCDTGFLPAGASDVSGLSGGAQTLFPDLVPMLEDKWCDTMHLVCRPQKMAAGNNLPSAAQQADAGTWRAQVVQGFSHTYRQILTQRTAFAAGMRAFADCSLRFIARRTPFYVLLLQESFHPDFLQQTGARAQMLQHLGKDCPAPALVGYEMADLMRADIPYFSVRPGAADLWGSHGVCVPDFFPQTGLAAALAKLERMSLDDCAQQVELINAALRPAAVADPRPSPALRAACLQRARQIAQQILAAAWPAQTDLYGGSAGICLFLAQLAQLQQDAELLQIALQRWPAAHMPEQAACRHLPEQALFAGPLSEYWAGALMRRLSADALPAFEIPAPQSATQEVEGAALDLFSGHAGAIIALLALYATEPEREAALARALVLGEHLLRSARPGPEGGLVWLQPPLYKPLAGFAHGNSGIAFALCKLFAASGDLRFRQAAQAAFIHERSLFLPEQGKWRDLRFAEESGARIISAWCHGAAGIALARLLCLPYFSDLPDFQAQLRQELQVALQTTLRDGLDSHHCLCHGAFGNMDILLLAGHVLQEPEWTAHAYRHLEQFLQQEEAWKLAAAGQTPPPGLMNGLAGVGYALLRMAAPQQVPSVLALEY